MYINVTTMKGPSNQLSNDLEKLTGKTFKNAKIPMKHVNIFLKHLFQFDNSFPKVKVRIKTRSLHILWKTKGIAKSSQRKQKLYEKCLKRRTIETDTAYKSY